jgi:tRNA(Ile)-lysidine synthase TilS/MesJ
MRCIACKKPAEIKITQPFCSECFTKHYQRRVERTIKKFKLIEKKDKVLVAVSGGKDSLSCADVLWQLGFDISVLHVDVGIKRCTNPRTKRVVEEFCKERKIPMYFTSFEKFFKIEDINKFFKIAKRPICATCGMLKRALFNRFARENGFTKIATGHCADDIVKYFFKTMLSGDEDSILWLSKLKPKTESSHPKIVARIRPLFEMLEVENLAYTKFRNIVVAGCVMCSYFQRKDKWTEILREVDKKIPDFKIKIAKTLERIQIIPSKIQKFKEEIKECSICREPTNQEVCAICKLKQKL